MNFLKSLFGRGQNPSTRIDREQALLELAKYWDSGTEDAKKIAHSFATLGPGCLPVLQEIALDTTLHHGLRKSALAVGSKVGGDEFATFMAQHFVNGKSSAALYAASQHGGPQANDFGMYREAEELLKGMGYQIRSVSSGGGGEKRDPSKFYLELVLQSGERVVPKMTVDSHYLSLHAGEEVSFSRLEPALVYITLEAAALRGNVPPGQRVSEVNLLLNSKAICGCSYEELFNKMQLLKDNGIYGVRSDDDVSKAVQLAWPQVALHRENESAQQETVEDGFVPELSCALSATGLARWKALVNMKFGDRAGAARLIHLEGQRQPSESIESRIQLAIDRLAEDLRRQH